MSTIQDIVRHLHELALAEGSFGCPPSAENVAAARRKFPAADPSTIDEAVALATADAARQRAIDERHRAETLDWLAQDAARRGERHG